MLCSISCRAWPLDQIRLNPNTTTHLQSGTHGRDRAVLYQDVGSGHTITIHHGAALCTRPVTPLEKQPGCYFFIYFLCSKATNGTLINIAGSMLRACKLYRQSRRQCTRRNGALISGNTC